MLFPVVLYSGSERWIVKAEPVSSLYPELLQYLVIIAKETKIFHSSLNPFPSEVCPAPSLLSSESTLPCSGADLCAGKAQMSVGHMKLGG